MKYTGSLHNHTDYSNETLRDCINTVKTLIDTAIELGHECVAITDHETISSYIKVEKYYKKIKEKNPKFKVIRGNEIYLTRDGLNKSNFEKGKDKYYHFILLCRDLEGYHQICQLSTRAWGRSYVTARQRRRPTYYKDLEEIVKPNQGHLIASSACLGSQLDKFLLQYMETHEIGYWDTAMSWCEYIQDIFGKGNFYLEMQPSNNAEQIFVNKCLLDISKELDIPYIITTDSHYSRPEKAAVHEAFLNAQEGEREVKSFYATTYMMKDEEIHHFFNYLTEDELQTAFQNIKEIKDRCEDFSVLKPLEIPSLPWRQFDSYRPDEYIEKMPALEKFVKSEYRADNMLVDAVIEGIRRHKDLQNEEAYKAINECLEMTWVSSEVNKARWSAYFLNLQKIIDECWNAGSLVMPARGSGAGFVLLYVLDIIQINCLREKTKMYPWRFLNPARVSVLDIDVDIEGGRREQVLKHLRKVYGENRVSNVATFRTEKSKAAVQTAARGLGIDVDTAQYVSGLIVSERGAAYTLSQMYYGDEDEGIKPNQTFIEEINKYDGWWETAKSIEGLICGVGIHAGGVVFLDKDFTDSSALMRAPDGTTITQYELHDLEDVSMIKMDLLSIEAADKIHTCLNLLIDNDYITPEPTLRETYEKVLGVYNIERDDKKMWDMVQDHKVISLFQMEQQSGIRGIALTHPRNVDELAILNSVIRLMATEKGAESPLDKYARFRMNAAAWENEMRQYGLTTDERAILHRELDISNGLSITQEQFMQLVQLPECGGWDLQFADKLRKAIAKKQPEAYEELTKQFFARVEEQHLSKAFCNYVWNIEVALSRGYGFNASHTYAYSIIALQEMNLARYYPIIFWNTANLIVDCGGEEIDLEDNEEEDIDIDDMDMAISDDEDAADDEEKVKNKSADYGKIATVIGKFKEYGITVAPPDINESSFIFTPIVEDNMILYGLRGITGVGTDIIKSIIANRPYTSMADFLERVKVKKPQMINLIKCGAFDKIENCPREEIMDRYLDTIVDKKVKLNLQNMQMLINKELIPDDMAFYAQLYLFNKFLKTCKNDRYYELNDAAINFISANFNADIIDDGHQVIQTIWDKTYSKAMEPMRTYLKEHQTELLLKLNGNLYDEIANKYGKGNISRWEMESVNYYSHEHELAAAQHNYDDFFSLSEEPTIDYTFATRNGQVISVYKLYQIIGTVIDKNKIKNTVTLLTPTGVVNVKIYKNQYSIYDKQISIKGDDGKKHVVEKSWFARGSLLMIQGIRRGNDFIPKKTKNSVYPIISKITHINDDGTLSFKYEREEG